MEVDLLVELGMEIERVNLEGLVARFSINEEYGRNKRIASQALNYSVFVTLVRIEPPEVVRPTIVGSLAVVIRALHGVFVRAETWSTIKMRGRSE